MWKAIVLIIQLVNGQPSVSGYLIAGQNFETEAQCWAAIAEDVDAITDPASTGLKGPYDVWTDCEKLEFPPNT